jgi:hypothetical protein
LSRDRPRHAVSATLASNVECSLGGEARGATLRDEGDRKEGEEGQPQQRGHETGQQPRNPSSGAQRAERRGSGHDHPAASSSHALGPLGIIGNAGESAHRHTMALDAPCLVVVMATQPHGDEYGCPQGDDRHIDQTRHINER